MEQLTVETTWALTLLLVVARVAGVVLVAPVFSEPAVPIRLRLFLSAAIGLAVVGRLAQPAGMPSNWFELAVGVGCEVSVGAAIGYAARLVFAGVELGAMHVAQQMGVGLAEAYDPQAEEPSGAVRRLLGMLALVIFLAIGGHRDLIVAVLRTFDAVPLMGFAPGQALLSMVVGLLGASFALALKVAAPVLIALLLATVALGLLQRTAPQFHIFSTGFPVSVMLGLLVLAAALAVLGRLVDAAWSMVMKRVVETMLSGR